MWDILGTIITTLGTLIAVYLAYWITQKRHQSEFFTIKVFEPLYKDILDIVELVEQFKARPNINIPEKYSTIHVSETWKQFTKDPILNIHLQNATRTRYRDVRGRLQRRSLKKDLEEFHKNFEDYQSLYSICWPVIEDDIKNYLTKPQVQQLLQTVNIEKVDTFIDRIIELLRLKDKTKRQLYVKRNIGITRVDTIEKLLEEIAKIPDIQKLYKEMDSLRNNIHIEGDLLLQELRKRMVYSTNL